MSETRMFLEQDPPSQAINASVVGFIVLVFITARALNTRGFAAFKPGFNTRAMVTWLAVASLSLLVIYSIMLAQVLYKESMAGYYMAPAAHLEKPMNISNAFPIAVTFQDMTKNPSWDLSGVTTPPDYDLYYILGMKAVSLYDVTDRHVYYVLRLVLRFAQCSLISCLLLLNTYWCHHVEALVDEGHFMSKGEMYTYWALAATVLVLPPGICIGLGLGLDNWVKASRVSDLCMLLLGLSVIFGYALTCARLRALERDSRNVTGEDTSTTLQLAYYIQCVYWLLGSMFAILVLGILYKVPLVDCGRYPVLAQSINDLQGALWSTLIILVYPAAMFLLYPSVDVLTQPENDPGARFQKRVRKSVKDAKRIRESLYVDGESGHGMTGGDGGRHGMNNHSSLHGLTSHLTLSSGVDNGPSQQQQQEPQQQSQHQHHKRRAHMDSITAVASEIQLESGVRDRQERDYGSSTTLDPSSDKQQNLGSHSFGQIPKRSSDSRNKTSAIVAEKSRRDSGSPSNYYEDSRDVETMKKFLAEHDNVDRDGLIADLEKTISVLSSDNSPKNRSDHTWAQNDSSAPTSQPGELPVNTAAAASSAPSSKRSSSLKPSAVVPAIPLVGILKTRDSTSSARSSVGQNPFDRPTLGGPTPAYGARTSSIQGVHSNVGSRTSYDQMPPVRRRSSSGAAKANAVAVSAVANSTAPPYLPTESPSQLPSPLQQRRSNVTTRVDAGALAIAAAAQHQHHRLESLSAPTSPASRTTKEGAIEMDYFGLRKFSFEENNNSTSASPMLLPYEPQSLPSGHQLHPEVVLSPIMTGFLMADPYPSAGTPYLGVSSSDSEHQVSPTVSLSDDDDPRKSGISSTTSSTATTKKYRAPPPPIPTHSVNAPPVDFGSQGLAPLTPTTPTTPPGVRPRRSVDAMVDKQILDIANQIYEDVAPTFLFPKTQQQTTDFEALPPKSSVPGPATMSLSQTPSHAPINTETPVSTATRSSTKSSFAPSSLSENASAATSLATSPTPPISYGGESGSNGSSSATGSFAMQQQKAFFPNALPERNYRSSTPSLQQQHFQPIPPVSQSQERVMTPPTRSPYRLRESFESRISQSSAPALFTNSSQSQQLEDHQSLQHQHQQQAFHDSRVNSPSPASTVSPTMTPASTLPRPLTPAWYETKTSFASTNDVLTHYNAVMRAGSYHRQQQQQQQSQQEQLMKQQQYLPRQAIGPLDDISTFPPSQYQKSQHTLQLQQEHLNFEKSPSKRSTPDSLNENAEQGYSRPSSLQPRMGSTDSFGVVRRRRSSAGRKEDADMATMISSGHSDDGVGMRDRHLILSQQEQQQQQLLQRQRQPSPKESSGQLGRHSFMLQPPTQHQQQGSEIISVYSTWTGELSDVTTTSGEVSVGAFLDRKKDSSNHNSRRKSSSNGEFSNGAMTATNKHSSVSSSTGTLSSGSVIVQSRRRSGTGEGSRPAVEDVRKSQASGYSMGSSFGANGSHTGSSGSRQSAGAYSTYSLYSTSTGFGSGPLVVSASLSSIGIPAIAPAVSASPTSVATTIVTPRAPMTQAATKRQIGGTPSPISSDAELAHGGNGYSQDPDIEVERIHRRSVDRTLMSEERVASLESLSVTDHCGAALTVLGPSQYRITTNAASPPLHDSETVVAASGLSSRHQQQHPLSPSRPHPQQVQQHFQPSASNSDNNNGNSRIDHARSQSPFKRTSSRLTNLTATESDYQWESAELDKQQWEMLH